MIKVGMKVGFFDSPKVLKAVDKATRKVFSRFGAFVRTKAKTSIRKRKGSSPPGSPPYSKVGTLRKFIYFAYDFAAKSVVIGPERFDSAKDKDAPSRLEYGGTVSGGDREIVISGVLTRDKSGRFVTGNKRIKVTGNLKYAARPYMGPAFKAELPGLPAMWRNSVR